MLTRLLDNPYVFGRDITGPLLLLLFAGAALAGGVAAASGNLMLIGAAVGLLMGVMLLGAVTAVVWIIIVGTLLVVGPVVFFIPEASRLPWLFSILGFFLSVAAIAHSAVRQHAPAGRLPAFVPLMVVFIVYAVLMLFLSHGPVEEGVSAIKRYFQYWGLTFALAVIAVPAMTVRRWVLFVVALAAVQLPFAVYQRIVLVPQRMHMPQEVVPIDIVAGTFEAEMWGAGNNNVMAFLLVIVLAGLLAAYRDRAIKGWSFALVGTVVFLPLTLGETKLVLLMLPLALFAVYADLIRKRPVAFVIGATLASAIIGVLGYFYIAVIQVHETQSSSFEQRLYDNFWYNFGPGGYYRGSLNRGNVIPFWWDNHGMQDPAGTLFGHGLGSSHASFGTTVIGGHIDRQYAGRVVGLTTIAGLLWDVGLVGALLYIAVLIMGCVTAMNVAARAPPGFERAVARALAASAIVCVSLLLTTNLILMAPSLQVLMALTFGLVAWQYRRQETRR